MKVMTSVGAAGSISIYLDKDVEQRLIDQGWPTNAKGYADSYLVVDKSGAMFLFPSDHIMPRFVGHGTIATGGKAAKSKRWYHSRISGGNLRRHNLTLADLNGGWGLTACLFDFKEEDGFPCFVAHKPAHSAAPRTYTRRPKANVPIEPERFLFLGTYTDTEMAFELTTADVLWLHGQLLERGIIPNYTTILKEES